MEELRSVVMCVLSDYIGISWHQLWATNRNHLQCDSLPPQECVFICKLKSSICGWEQHCELFPRKLEAVRQSSKYMYKTRTKSSDLYVMTCYGPQPSHHT